ncbi:MAG: cation-translocating P-type ATPase, partial [Bacteroidetes bacterium]|nr:cation-translocating P-type ATPase [Bacteroidota bacterium]
LLVAAIIYFISGQTGDAIFLAAAIVLVATISLYQDSRSRNALAKLQQFTQPNCKVIREYATVEIKSEELVIGDCLIIEEGNTIPADGKIIHSNDFSVNESMLSGESLSVFKDKDNENPFVYKGTTVASGLAIAEVTAIGNKTKLGEIGKSLKSIEEEKTPLEKQISNFVKKMVFAGAIVFFIVWAINYINSKDLFDSLLKALTLAMSILPEEIPVAFTSFMAIGAYRLMKMGIVVKQMKTVETLGSATVICTDKTGTITENKMSLAKLYCLIDDTVTDMDDVLNQNQLDLLNYSMWSSEPIPFDPMEIAIHEAYTRLFKKDERTAYKMTHEYPLSGQPPMMTHIFEDQSGHRIIAAKGAPEAIIKVSYLTDTQSNQIESIITTLAAQGFRVLGVGRSTFEGSDFPDQQQDLPFQFIGLIAFYDPPKHNISNVFQNFYDAGINVKIVTGDNAATTMAIAKEVNFKGYDKSITGDELMALDDQSLLSKVQETQIFSRMFPEAKLRIIKALKANNEVVAMTGDGVNDGPALKAAHIGIAMGKKGTEIAKEAASLVLMEDDLSKMVDAVAMGRKIYSNLKKAIQYIISIHIPIILVVFIPLALGWVFPNIFTPVHIIFLELIMGPTCSIVYENEPIEKNAMRHQPRPFTSTFFNGKELTTSIIQGIMITIGALLVYQYAVGKGLNEDLTRTMVFVVLIAANITLTLVNRSFYYSILTTLSYKNRLAPLMIGITLFITALLLYIPPLTKFFKFGTLSLTELSISIVAGFIFVIWFELVKWYKRNQIMRQNATT